MTVTIFANYLSSRESGYVVPACTNFDMLKARDVRLELDSVFQTGDTDTIDGALDNAIPREAAFTFDDIDISSEYQKGDQPTQNFQIGIFGSPVDTLYQLAEAEETDGNEIVMNLYMGNPGNRVLIKAPFAKVRFQAERLTYGGALNQSIMQIDVLPVKSPPLNFTAFISQSETFLTV